MVTETSLTNILVVNGVSQIRYRAYSDTCERSTLLDSLKRHTLSNPLIQAFHELCDLNIPCTWRAPRSNNHDSTVKLELWVFWFDERHTGRIDANVLLNELEEFNVGSFTWEKVTNGLTTAKSSAAPGNKRPRSLVAMSEEYKLFIRSVRNLLHRAFLSNGSIPVGDFYIMSEFSSSSQYDLLTNENYSASTIPAFAYNAYISGTDLVFRPYTRQLRLRRLLSTDEPGTKVILGPSGEHAYITPLSIQISEHAREKVFSEWSALFNMPLSGSIVAIRNKANATVLYPAMLVFVPTSIRESPATLAGMNGILGQNRGLTQDVGKKWSQWAWSDQFNRKDDCRVNYWNYNKKLYDNIFDALAATSALHEQVVLQRMIEQPVNPSPVMAAKSVRTPSLSPFTPPTTNDVHDNKDVAAITHVDSLHDFITRTFGITVEEAPTIEEPELEQIQLSHENENSNDNTDEGQKETEAAQPENMVDFGLSYGADEYHGWDGGGLDNDLEDFDFDVTEADFDFFASSVPDSSKKAIPTSSSLMQMTESSMLSMDIATTTDNALGITESITDQPLKTEDLLGDEIMTTAPMPGIAMVTGPLETDDTKMPGFNVSPIASEVTAVASSDAGASTTVPATFDTSIYTMTPESRSPTLVLTKSGYTSEHQHLVPRDFAPVSFVAGVNDSKYLDGGKFTYDDTNDDKPKQRMYRPDYIPRKLMKSRRKAARLLKNQTAPIEVLSSSESESTTSSSDESDDESTSSSISLSSQEEEDVDPVDRLESAQMIFVRRLLGDIKNKPKRHRIANLTLDYDSPFGSITVDSIHPEKLTSSDIASLDQLCQQTVWGGYPFAGQLPNSISSCADGTYCNDTAEAVVARQTELIQSIRGDITHVPCLPSTTTRAISDFKSILEEVFHSDSDGDLIPPIGSVTVKGPLKVQEFYELSENAPVHSKYYGKFQVKKRKSAEPNLSPLSPPEIIVGRQDDWVEGSTAMVGLWEKLRLEPYSFKNNVLYFVVYPDNSDLASQLSTFFANLNSVYETCQLGIHRPGNTEQFYHGAVPVPLPSGDISWKKGYMAACENLGLALARTDIMAQERGISNIVIYLMNPSNQLSSNLDLSRCFRRLLTAYTSTTRHHQPREFSTNRFVMQIVPLDHALQLGNTCTMLTLKDIAFSIYSQCRTIKSREGHVDHVRSISSFYTPPWIIAQPPPESIKLSIKKPLISFPTVILDPSATIHMAYSFSLDRRWMVLVWSDHRGELLEFAVLEIQTTSSKAPGSPLVKVFTEAWTRTRNIARRTGTSWNYALAKIGLIFESELQAWFDVFNAAGDSDEKVAIVSIDLESPFHFDEEYPQEEDAPVSDATYTYASYSTPLNSTTTTIQPSTTTATASTKQVLDDGTCMIMLNHRVAYSRQRVNIYQGDLAMEPMNELDSWILSLSTGYLVLSRNPALEQGLPRSQPLTIELHLVYNNLLRTPYTALHDIIKQYHALSYVNYPPSYASNADTTLLPTHIALVERLCRILLVVGS
ncbi:mediator complex subunit 13 C-terminal-domain-containing protein [Fennellomyces sp. T-0311]|nr:mediator complex subunit 13 C-terminal-domain-containing protein [Fennellomyces sp. T-0311]